MTPSLPLVTSNGTILWLKAVLTAALLAALYVRYKRRDTPRPSNAHTRRTKVLVLLAVLFSFAVFHNFGKPRSGTFVHYGEMFHYYLGAKYFEELGYYELYNAVIIADSEQDNSLVGLPFYTNLTNYQNVPRELALKSIDRVKGRFSNARWDAFKHDVSFFKQALATPGTPVLSFLVMDHGYTASPAATVLFSALTNAVPVTQLTLLAALDVLLVAAMAALVFRTFGFDMGALFSVYFCVNILNDHGYVSGGLLRYDWLFCIVAAVCLFEKRRHASAAAFLAASAMLRIFPVVLFYGVAVTMFQRARAARGIDRESRRLIVAAGITGLALFLLPAAAFGSVLQPWKEFSAKTALHDSGVYVNHLGLRGIVLFESSHLSLERFTQTYKSIYTPDIVRHWQDVKEAEFKHKKPVIAVCSLFVLACLTTLIWKRRAPESESVLWPLLLVYTASYPAHYYYAFLCLFVLLFFRRPNSLDAFVPICALLILNIGTLVTDSFRPSPIVFYTLVNIYLFSCMCSILGFELYSNIFRRGLERPVANAIGKNVSARRRRSKKTHKALRRDWGPRTL